MPKLENESLIEQFYEHIKDKLPEGVDFDHLRLICKAPFKFITASMSREDLPIINVKYFGQLLPTSNRMKEVIFQLKRDYTYGYKKKEDYDPLLAKYETKLSELLENEQRRKLGFEIINDIDEDTDTSNPERAETTN